MLLLREGSRLGFACAPRPMKVAHVLGRNEYRAEPTGIHGEYTSRRLPVSPNWIKASVYETEDYAFKPHRGYLGSIGVMTDEIMRSIASLILK